MRHARFFRMIGWLFAAALLLAFASYFMIRKTCCSERLDEDEIRELERAATNGDVPAMKRLYRFFDEDEQPAVAEGWLKRAADAGDADAELHMFSRRDGSDDPAQKAIAMDYLHRSAEHGSSLAQSVLGERYRNGDGVTRNMATARSWFEKAARGGDIDGILALCDMAAAERDLQQCRECLVLQNRGLASVHPESYYATQLREQRERVQRVVDEAAQ